MARYVVIKPVTIASSGYTSPGRSHVPGHVLELSAAEVTALGAGNLRTTVPRDALGEGAAASNTS